MKRIFMLLLTSSCVILATPEYEIRITLKRHAWAQMKKFSIQTNNELDLNFTSDEHECKYALNIKLLSVINNKATLAYLINRQKPNPTSHTDFNRVEVETDLQQQISCLCDDHDALWVKINSTPTESSSCIIL